MSDYNKTLIHTILGFSLRIDAEEAAPNLQKLIENAFGSSFHDRDYHGLALREMHLLGMTIHFLAWRSIGLKEVYQLVAYTEVPEIFDHDEKLNSVDLNQAMIDLLRAKGAGTWHIPTMEELRAEASAEVSSAMEDENFGPSDGCSS